MEKCVALLDEYKKALEVIETEYERRFGVNPSDIDDDFWIDTFHYGNVGICFADIIEQARFSVKLKK